MFDLRDQLIVFEKSKSLFYNLIKDKTIVLLGYESSDKFDKFFNKVMNDIGYESDRPITKKMYFVNQLSYNTNYGLWRNTREEDKIAINLNIKEFILKLTDKLR